ncbi:MAG: hypothetical protein INR71_06495, partial [Terriglobus roseus]|nr:hypothetical protein [Terriglobus roseus]
MAKGQRSIQAFGRISKVHSQEPLSKKRKADSEAMETPAAMTPVCEHKKRCVETQQTPVDTPTLAISQRLAGLELARASSTAETRRAARSTASPTHVEDTPPTSPCLSSDVEHDAKGLPEELEDFRSLNTAFLAALSLHYAHHGTASPMDVRQLTPSMTRMWGKRKVTPADIKRCLVVFERAGTGGTTSPFQLFDYGGGRVCIELVDFEGRTRMGTHFDQDRSARAFEHGLWQEWARFTEQDDEGQAA